MSSRFFYPFAAVLLLASGGCSTLLQNSAGDLHIVDTYSVQAENGGAIARLTTRAARCPAIDIDGRSQPMQLRVAAAIVPARSGLQQDSKEAVFPLAVCEAALPRGTRNAQVGDRRFAIAPVEIRHIVLLGDSGCRLKLSDNAFQSCNDAPTWPLAQVIRSAAALKPDLVIHVGDLHYRESPCPEGNAGCVASPWGFGQDAWSADFFAPAAPLLRIAPWVFVRGNHETCARAGQGWFRFMDLQPWSVARSCNDSALDGSADFSRPYAVALDAQTQLIVFDSSKAGGRIAAPDSSAFRQTLAQFQEVDRLAATRPHNFFTSHHPVLGFAPGKDASRVRPGDEALQAVMRVLHPQRLFPPGVELAVHGHVHLFEAIGFASDHPTTLVVGNSASLNEGKLPVSLPAGAAPAAGVIVNHFMTHGDYGFASLDKTGDDWEVTEFDVNGRALIKCALASGKLACRKL